MRRRHAFERIECTNGWRATPSNGRSESIRSRVLDSRDHVDRRLRRCDAQGRHATRPYERHACRWASAAPNPNAPARETESPSSVEHAQLPHRVVASLNERRWMSRWMVLGPQRRSPKTSRKKDDCHSSHSPAHWVSLRDNVLHNVLGCHPLFSRRVLRVLVHDAHGHHDVGMRARMTFSLFMAPPTQRCRVAYRTRARRSFVLRSSSR